MHPRLLVIPAFLFFLAGCYGPGVMGWGMNGTQFEVDRNEGTVEVTAVGRGPMNPVPPGASPEYEDEPAQWDDFALQLERGGSRVSLNYPAGASSPEMPAGQPWSLGQLATDPIRLGDVLYFCHEAADLTSYRFGVVMEGTGPQEADYNLAFDRLTKC